MMKSQCPKNGPLSGRLLYDPQELARNGVELSFFEEWRGSQWSILYRLLTEPAGQVAAEIKYQT